MMNLLTAFLLMGFGSADVYMVSPYPGSDWQSPDSRMIISTCQGAESIDASAVGSLSGRISLDRYLSEDGRTAVFTPEKPLEHGETVQVEAGAMSWEFSVRPYEIPSVPSTGFSFDEMPSADFPSSGQAVGSVQLPFDFPGFELSIPGEPAPGFFLFAPFNPFGWDGLHYLIALDDEGEVLFYRHATHGIFCAEIQSDNCLSYGFMQPTGQYLWFEVDSSYRLVDTYKVDGYDGTDEHDFTILSDDNVLLMGYEHRVIDMSQIVPGGNPEAIVRGLIIQIQDRNHMPLFNWSSFDHIPVEDAATYIDLTSSNIDYVHCNSVAEDLDGNLIFSGLSLCCCVKIDRLTGDVIWRLGGSHASVNDFTIVGDPLGGFNSQHDFEVSGPDRYTMFDNGTWHAPKASRGLEYEIDTDEMTATLVWSYAPMYYYGTHLGSMQALPDGNRVIGWGDLSLNYLTDIHEVDQSGSLQATVRYTPSALESYRAYKFEWEFQALQPYLVAQVPTGEQHVLLTYNVFGEVEYPLYRIYQGTSPDSLSFYSTTDDRQTVLWNLPQGMNYFAVTALDQALVETGFSNTDSALVEWTSIGDEGTEEQASGRLFVTPNPCSGSARVFLPGVSDGEREVGIFDISGRMVSSVRSLTGSLSVTVDVSDLASGLYFVRFLGDSAVPAAGFIKVD